MTEETLMQKEKEIRLKLSTEERAVFDEATQKGFIVNRRLGELQNAFYRWCDMRKQPCVSIVPKTKHASVYLDLDTAEKRVHKDAVEELKKIVYRYSESGHCSYGPSRPGADKVKIEEAEAFARELMSFVESDLNVIRIEI